MDFDANELIKQRAEIRGSFADVATKHMDIAKSLCPTRQKMSDVELVALTMIAHKLARIMTAPKFDDDSWKDIAGYATLVIQNTHNE